MEKMLHLIRKTFGIPNLLHNHFPNNLLDNILILFDALDQPNFLYRPSAYAVTGDLVP